VSGSKAQTWILPPLALVLLDFFLLPHADTVIAMATAISVNAPAVKSFLTFSLLVRYWKFSSIDACRTFADTIATRRTALFNR
jgi:hypothetical protein